MEKVTGFLRYSREDPQDRPVYERIRDSREVLVPLGDECLRRQSARCMDCGIPFCHAGCPLGNTIPDWNDLVFRNRWKEAYLRLRATNNFPEFTGRICPAPCESACVLGLNSEPVTIEHIERQIIERAFEEGWVQPAPPLVRTGRQIAVVGSGPAGLATADQLNRSGHTVTVFERHDQIGGLLRYGIPDFKLEKWVLDRRIDLMRAEGIVFRTNARIGETVSGSELDAFDATVLCTGCTRPRDIDISGRDLDGIHFAWEFLSDENRRVAGERTAGEAETPFGKQPILATGKHVIVIGGGDSGSDCVGVANRHGALSITQFELLEQPPVSRPDHQPWPSRPLVLKTTSSHREGARRHWGIMTVRFGGESGHVSGLQTTQVEPDPNTGTLRPSPNTEKEWPADLVLLAIGYTGPESELCEALHVERDERGNMATDGTFATNRPGVFAAGDARRGQSLVVWAISEGREVARAVDAFLMQENIA